MFPQIYLFILCRLSSRHHCEAKYTWRLL